MVINNNKNKLAIKVSLNILYKFTSLRYVYLQIPAFASLNFRLPTTCISHILEYNIY